MKHRHGRPLVPLAVIAALALVACDASDPSHHPAALLAPDAPRLVTTSYPQSLKVADSLDASKVSALAQMRVTIGGVTTTVPVTWSTTASAVATVSSKGMVVGKSAGSAKIIASYSSLADTVPVSVVVSTAPIASVSLSAPTTSLSVGSSVQVTLTARDASGNVVNGGTVSWKSANPAIASVSSSGVVLGVAAGSTTISATAGGLTGVLTVTVLPVVTPPPVVIGPMTLPAPPTLLTPRFPTVTGKTWLVNAGASLQSVLNQAQRGDEIVLQAGATFTGNFVLPAKAGTPANGWIIVRSERLASLPPAGTRVTPAQASLMPRLFTTSVAPVLQTAPGATGWWISGIEMTVDPALTYIHYGLVLLGDGSSKQTSLTGIPSDLVLDRTYIHGAPNGFLIRCVALNSARTAIQDSYIQDCHAKGFDSQAIGGWNGPGPFRIVNNTLAGAGENIMFGGADPAIPNLIPSDIEIRRNYVYTPLSWKGAFTKKNLFEVKNGQRILIEDNVFEGSWLDAQTGYAFILKVANQSGRCTWCFSGDITIRRNLIRNAGAGFGITGKDGTNPIGGLLDRLLIEQNVVEEINVGQYTGDAKLVSIMNNAQNVTIRRNTMTSTGMLMQYLNIGTKLAATNFAFHDNVVSYGKYGFFSSWYGIGEVSMATIQGTAVFANVAMVGPSAKGYPHGSFWQSMNTALSTGGGIAPSIVATATQGVIIP